MWRLNLYAAPDPGALRHRRHIILSDTYARSMWRVTYPCHGDVFHIQHQCEGLANTLSRLAKGATSRREKLEARIDRAGQQGPDCELVIQLELARQTEAQADYLARELLTPLPEASKSCLSKG